MPSRRSPSSAVQAARQALADQLKDIRLGAGWVNARAFSAACDWSIAKTSRIENGHQDVTPADIEKWCRVCGAPHLVSALVARLRIAEGAYVEWRRLQRGGLRRLQQSYVPLHERTSLFRYYQASVIPGMLQTPRYARAMLEMFAARQGTTVDEGAVEARIERQSVLDSDRRFVFVLEESAVRGGLGGREVMDEQRAHLRAVAARPNVEIGVIPSTDDRTMWAMESVTIYDSAQVGVELVTAMVTVTEPDEVSRYIAAFNDLAAMAVDVRAHLGRKSV